MINFLQSKSKKNLLFGVKTRQLSRGTAVFKRLTGPRLFWYKERGNVMKIGLLGHGTIGIGTDRIVSDLPNMEVTKIMSLVDDPEMRGRWVSRIEDITEDPEIDTVVEVMGGVHPAFDFIAAAMKAGKNVVTANKAVVAACYTELIALAKENNVCFRCTASVGGGIAWLLNLARAKRIDTIGEIGGIMNGTTNFIMNAMNNEGADFEETLKKAQEIGFAERDPSADIDGPDIRRKICISANVAYDAVIDETEIPCFGIRYVTDADIENASQIDKVIKLVAKAVRTENGVAAYVEPVMLPNTDLLSDVPSNHNLIYFEAKNGGRQSFIGEGAGRFPTAYNVVQDLQDITEGQTAFYTDGFTPMHVDNSTEIHDYYVRKGETIEILKQVSVAEMHRLAEDIYKECPNAFIAGIL